MLIPKSVLQEIKGRLDIVTIVNEYIPHLKRSGKNWVGLCPFHNDKNPSLSVSSELGIFKCFSCGESGDLIAFVQKIEKTTFNEAVYMLAKKAGVVIEENYDVATSGLNVHRDELIQFNERLAKLFQHFLLKSEEAKRARDYLKGRGVNLDLVKKFKIGYAPKGYDRLLHFLTKKGFKEDFLLETGVFSKNEGKVRTLFFDRIMFPVFNHNGECIGFGGRAIEKDAKPKYINTIETIVYKKSNSLYGINLAKKSIVDSKKVYLVEGYMDVITCHKAGLENVVAPCGTAVTRDHMQLLNRYADEVVFLMDGDDAGKKGVVKGLNESINTLINKSVIILPDNLDPDDYFKKKSFEDFRNLEKERIDGFDFLIKYYTENIDKRDIKNLLKAFGALFDYISKWESDVIKNGFVERIAEKLNLDKILVAKEYLTYKNKIKKGNFYNKNENPSNSDSTKKVSFDKRLKRELELFVLLLQLEDGVELIKTCGLREEHFVNRVSQELYNSYLNLKKDQFSKNFLNYFDDDRIKKYLEGFFFSSEVKQNSIVIKNSVVDRIIEIIKNYYATSNREINEKIRLSQFYRDEELLRNLQEEKTIIINEILKLSKLQELKK